MYLQAYTLLQVLGLALAILLFVLFIFGIKIGLAILDINRNLSRFVDLEYQKWHEQHKAKEESEFIHENAISRFSRSDRQK